MTSGVTSEHRLAFVCGLHRSGTSALARVIGAHPQVSNLSGTGVKEDEGQHLQDVYLRARKHGGPGRFAFAPGAHLTRDDARRTHAAAERLLASWAPFWDLSCDVLLEKSPPNLLMTAFLHELFPAASFVAITRHPVAVALSTSKWLRWGSMHRSVEHWLRAHEIFAEDSAHLPRVHVMRYEQLVEDPIQPLRDVGDFLGLDGEIPSGGWRSDRSLRYEQQWHQMAGSSRGRGVRARIVNDFAERVAAFGYDVDDLGSWSPTFPVTGRS